MKTLPPRSPSLWILAWVLLLSGLGCAQMVYPLRLSENRVPNGDILDFEFSPDGKRVVYLAEHDTNLVSEIYSASVAGDSVVKLNGTLTAGGDTIDFKISEDGSRVIYLADQVTNGVLELYSVPIVGGAAVKLNGPLPLGGDVLDFQISPDASCVVYRADQEINQTFDLYSVPILGGTAERLNGALAVGHDVQADFQISEDGSCVVYRADQDIDNVVELYSVPVVGGLPTKLNRRLPLGGDVFEFQIKASPEGNPNPGWVVYFADQDNDQVFELYSVPIEGGTAVKLNAPLPTGGNVVEFEIDPNSKGEGAPKRIRVVYLADQEMNGTFELYSTSILGEEPVKLSGVLTPTGDVIDFQFSQDGSHVVYSADQEAEALIELYSVPAQGGEAVKLNGALVLGGDVVDFEVSSGLGPDDIRVVYRADQETNQTFELYSVPLLGGTTQKLNASLATGAIVLEFEVSPDGRQVGYLADQETNLVAEVYNVPIEGGEPLKLNGTLVQGGDVLQFKFSPDGGRLAYIADQETDNLVDLYVWVTATPETYAEFAAFHGLLTAPGGDDEGDGLLNAFEYLTGRNPLRSDPGVELPAIKRIGDEVQISFEMVLLADRSDLILEVKTSTTLQADGSGGWKVIASRIGNAPWTGSAPVILTPAGNGLEQVTIVNSTGGDQVQFYRLDLQVVSAR